MNHTERLKTCLQRVICDPGFTLAELDTWFSPDYCQQVNGETLDYAAFRQHIAALRGHLAEAAIETATEAILAALGHVGSEPEGAR